ncbi:DNA cytosine methyltransferase [Microbacterium sp. ProA8]|uniref:DNA cytosine methyltransferase n=1 Tax=Microbacterium chionoecetis TaxID=3153754 RepID=UPI003262E133
MASPDTQVRPFDGDTGPDRVVDDETSFTSPRRPVAIDLFSGAGGLSLGFESAGFDVLSAVEYDPVHAATHLYNFPLTDVLCADVTSVSKEDLLASARRGWEAHYPGVEWDGVVDAIIGGPSCQGFSTMGNQDADDERNQLIHEFVRLVCEIRPRAFCMENVPGLLDARFDRIRSRALGELRQAGYKVSGQDVVLKAEDYGVPQKRRRVVILGVLDAELPPAAPAKLPGAAFTVADAFEGLPDLWRYPSLDTTDVIRLTSTAQTRRRSAAGDYVRVAGILADGGDHRGHARVVDHTILTGCRRTRHSKMSTDRFDATKPGNKEPVSRYYRLSLDTQALTLRAGTGRERGAFSAARPLHPTSPRVITVREAARLHSFPDWFRFHTTNWHAHRQIGNAVPPLLARAAAESLLAAIGAQPRSSDRGRMELGDEMLISLSPTEAAAHLAVSTDQVPKRKRSQADAGA